MTKQRLNESMKSLLGSHIGPEKYEQLKGTKRGKPSVRNLSLRSGYWSLQHEITQSQSKRTLLLPYSSEPPLATEVEDKMKRILNLIKDEYHIVEGNGIGEAQSKIEQLVELIEDFHKQYQSLYARYEHLTGELKKETFSLSKEQGRKDGQLESEFQKITDGLRQELETTKVEVASLKTELTTSREEKEALNSEHLSALSKIQESEKMIADLKIEAKRLAEEKSKLVHDNEDLVAARELNEKHESEVEEKVRKLEAKASQEGREKEKLIKAIREKDKRLLGIGEEKRQAIRQLCISIEYHRSRYCHIKYATN